MKYLRNPKISYMSVHIAAKPGEIAKQILMPGDPLRAKYIADNYLQNAQLVSSTRNIYFYTGNYKGQQISVGASGMGCPSIGIYSYELYTEYEVDSIIRIGTCGAYTADLKLFDIINVDNAYSESSFALYAWGFDENRMPHQGKAFDKINLTSQQNKQALLAASIHSSDIFYRKNWDIPVIAKDNNCVAVEMEAFSLFANARHLQKTAACLLTVSDVIPTGEKISADQREKALHPMIELALESSLV